jgi:hypothetical protein
MNSPAADRFKRRRPRDRRPFQLAGNYAATIIIFYYHKHAFRRFLNNFHTSGRRAARHPQSSEYKALRTVDHCRAYTGRRSARFHFSKRVGISSRLNKPFLGIYC